MKHSAPVHAHQVGATTEPSRPGWVGEWASRLFGGRCSCAALRLKLRHRSRDGRAPRQPRRLSSLGLTRVDNPAGRGFTLIELTLAVSLGMMIAAMAMALFNQQLAFLRIYRVQDFLTEEAPVINLHVSKLVGQAERFRLHDSVADALSGANPRTTASPVVVLNFRQPDGVVRAAILAFQNLGTGPALYYYVVPVSGVMGTPQWYISKQPSNIAFTVETGILRMTLTGPNGEVIIYSGAMTQ